MEKLIETREEEIDDLIGPLTNLAIKEDEKEQLKGIGIKIPRNRYRASTFLLTLNTNKAFNVNSSFMNASTKLTKAFELFATHKYKNGTYIKYREREFPDYIKINEKTRFNKPYKINILYVLERGPNKHRLHLHALIDIMHSSNIHIDLDYIRSNFVTRYLKFYNWPSSSNIYVNVKHIRQNSRNIFRYMKKTFKKGDNLQEIEQYIDNK